METKHVVLHRYFIWADLMRADFDRWIESERNQPDPSLDGFTYLITAGGTYMSLWYAALYVVVEGWRELRLQDAAVERLLASSSVDLLRRYRNGVCHFQAAWLDARLEEFVSSRDSVGWVRELHSAFGAYFLAMYPQMGRGA